MLRSLHSLLTTTGMDSSSMLGGQFISGLTVFAPTDAAFARMAAHTNEFGADPLATLRLPPNLAKAGNILSYHVLPESVLAADLLDGQILNTVAGQTLLIRVSEPNSIRKVELCLVDGTVISAVTRSDVVLRNGVIHFVDSVMLPPTDCEDNAFTLLNSAPELRQFAQLFDSMGFSRLLSASAPKLTIFAPTNDAVTAWLGQLGVGSWEKMQESGLMSMPLLVDLAAFHIVPAVTRLLVGADVQIDTLSARRFHTQMVHQKLAISQKGGRTYVKHYLAPSVFGAETLVLRTINACNGVIHVVSNLLALPKACDNNLLSLALSVPKLSVFAELLLRNEWTALLVDLPSNVTIFVPANDAFNASQPFAAVQRMINPQATLFGIVLQHLIPNTTVLPITYSWAVGEYFSCSVTCGMGIQFRSVFCMDDTTRGGVEDTNCKIGTKPDGSRSCVTVVCASGPSFLIPPKATPVRVRWFACACCRLALQRL